jgi:hypothetical protein
MISTFNLRWHDRYKFNKWNAEKRNAWHQRANTVHALFSPFYLGFSRRPQHKAHYKWLVIRAAHCRHVVTFHWIYFLSSNILFLHRHHLCYGIFFSLSLFIFIFNFLKFNKVLNLLQKNKHIFFQDTTR